MLKTIIAAASALAAIGGPANAAGWALNAARCPDLVEDRLDRRESRIDRRVTLGPLDRIEDRIDRRESRRE